MSNNNDKTVNPVTAPTMPKTSRSGTTPVSPEPAVTQMRFATLTQPGTLQIQTGTLPQPGTHDVLVKVELCGVCRTDRKAFNIGQRDLVTPRVLGHETVGCIHQIGVSVNNLSPGQRVQIYPGSACGLCPDCLAGNDHLCAGVQIYGFHLDGGFSEYLLVKGKNTDRAGYPDAINILPDHLDFSTASLAEPVACVVNIFKRLDLNRKTTVIFGAGPLGVLSAQLARHMGASLIIVVEPQATRRRLAALVSDIQLDFNERTNNEIFSLTSGSGAEIVIPCTPDNAAFESALQVASKRGTVCFFSGLTDDRNIDIKTMNNIHYKELSVTGSYGCSSADVRVALELLAKGCINLDGLPTLNISWDDLADNLADMNPAKHIFTFFYPNARKADHTATKA